MNLERPVYLTGFMASGKSTVGPRLARRLGVPFIDLDNAIVKRAGKSIRAIFDEDGEQAFRQYEEAELRRTGDQPTVVSLGGGALAQPGNLTYALKSGTVVFLSASVDVIAERLRKGDLDRPMLRGEDGLPLDGEALRARIRRLLKSRIVFYERAHVTVDTSGKEIDEIVGEVVARLEMTES